MTRPLTTNAKGWQRIGRVVQEVEGAPLQSLRQQRKWPIAGGGSSLRLAYITQDNGSGGNQWFAGGLSDPLHVMTCNSKPDGTGTEYTVYLRYAKGVWFTGEALWIVRAHDNSAGDSVWQPAENTRGEWPIATADGDIVSIGFANIPYFSNIVPGSVLCRVPVTLWDSVYNVTTGKTVFIEYDQNSRTFYVMAATC